MKRIRKWQPSREKTGIWESSCHWKKIKGKRGGTRPWVNLTRTANQLSCKLDIGNKKRSMTIRIFQKTNFDCLRLLIQNSGRNVTTRHTITFTVISYFRATEESVTPGPLRGDQLGDGGNSYLLFYFHIGASRSAVIVVMEQQTQTLEVINIYFCHKSKGCPEIVQHSST